MRALYVIFTCAFLLGCSEDKEGSFIFEQPMIDESNPLIEPEPMKPMEQTPLEC